MSFKKWRWHFLKQNMHFIQLLAVNFRHDALLGFQNVVRINANCRTPVTTIFCSYNLALWKSFCSFSWSSHLDDHLLLSKRILISSQVTIISRNGLLRFNRNSIEPTSKPRALRLAMSPFGNYSFGFFPLLNFLRWSDNMLTPPPLCLKHFSDTLK